MRDEGFLFPREHRIRLSKKYKDKLWKLITERDGGECVYCRMVYGRHTSANQHHHVKMLSQWGGDTAGNVVLLCVAHHTGNEDESAHGNKKKMVRKVLEEYLQSGYVQNWLKEHKEELDEIYKHERG